MLRNRQRSSHSFTCSYILYNSYCFWENKINYFTFSGCSKRRRISIQNDSAPAIRNKDSPPDAAASSKPVFVPLLPSKEKRLSPAFLPMLHPKVSEGGRQPIRKQCTSIHTTFLLSSLSQRIIVSFTDLHENFNLINLVSSMSSLDISSGWDQGVKHVLFVIHHATENLSTRSGSPWRRGTAPWRSG